MTSNDEIRELIDKAAIVEVATKYTIALDTQDWTSLGALFSSDAEVSFGPSVGSATGPEEIVATISGTLTGLDASQHLVGNHLVSVDGDTATHTCYLQAQHVRTGTPGGDQYIVAGHYSDRFRREDDGWRITYRELIRTWGSGNRAVIHR